MTHRRYAAQMPEGVRHLVRARHHPARAVPCPHCGAAEHRPCTTRSKRVVKPGPCPGRITAWIRATAVCPACQVELGVPCHQGGWELPGGAVHPQREALAQEAA